MFPYYIPFPSSLVCDPGFSAMVMRVYDLMRKRSINTTRPAYGGRISIARELGSSETTAKRCLDWLEEKKLLVKTFASRGGRGIANVYRVVLAGQRSGVSAVIAQTQKLASALATSNPHREKIIEKVAIETKQDHPVIPGSPMEKVRSLLNSLKSSKP